MSGHEGVETGPVPGGSLEEHEASGLTFVGREISAQSRDLSTLGGRRYNLVAIYHQPSGTEILVGEDDARKLRDLLAEITARGRL